jgi:Domain of unknown function (DUF4129)
MRGNAARAFVPALAVLALVAVVAVASRGSTPAGSGDRRGPSELLLDTLLSFTLLLCLAGIATAVYAIIHRKELGNLTGGVPRRRSTSAVIGLGVLLFLVGLALYFRSRGWTPGGEDDRPLVELVPPSAETDGEPSTYEPEFAWVPVLVVVALGAIAAGAAYVSLRRRKRRTPRALVAATIADLLDDSLDDLRAEKDPRRAVIAAYARLERVLAAHGLAKRAPETPEEYLARILPELEVAPESVRRLTELFTWAKFSHHEVGLGMKEEAIEALSTVRDDLRAAQARADEQDAEALSALGRPA